MKWRRWLNGEFEEGNFFLIKGKREREEEKEKEEDKDMEEDDGRDRVGT